MSTPAELVPLSEKVLVWVAKQRTRKASSQWTHASDDDLRRIELMALAVRESAYLQTLYPAPLERKASE